MALRNNLQQALRNPRLGWHYLWYLGQSALTSRGPIVTLWEEVKIGGFCSFSEYHTCRLAVSPPEHAFFQRLSLKQGAILDIGANLGVVTVLLARRFQNHFVHAFEPGLTTYAALKENIARNRLSNVLPRQLAVSNQSGAVFFDPHPRSRAKAKITTQHDAASVEVPCTSLDTYVQEHAIEEVAFMKVDVEGYEPLVFEGARGLLTEQRIRMIYFEVCPYLLRKASFSQEELLAPLLDAGYRFFRLTQRGAFSPVAPFEAQSINLENWVAVPGGLSP